MIHKKFQKDSEKLYPVGVKEFRNLANLLTSFIRKVAGGMAGLAVGYVYLAEMELVNQTNKRVKLSSGLVSIIRQWLPDLPWDEVVIIPNSKSIPAGGFIAVTHFNSIFWKGDFSESNAFNLKVLLHELYHVDQYRRDGKLFYYQYGASVTDAISYKNSTYELEATKFAELHFADLIQQLAGISRV